MGIVFLIIIIVLALWILSSCIRIVPQAYACLLYTSLVGTVEIVVFPRDYEKYQQFTEEEAKVFVQGRVSAEDDKASKLILEKVRPFEDIPRELWVQFADKAEYSVKEQEFFADLQKSKGTSSVVVYLKDVKMCIRDRFQCQLR